MDNNSSPRWFKRENRFSSGNGKDEGNVSSSVLPTFRRLRSYPRDQGQVVPEKDIVTVDKYQPEAGVKEKLSPRVERDQFGHERVIYSWKGKTFSFQSKEELPEYPTLSSSAATYLGREPLATDKAQWNVWKDKLPRSGMTHYCVDSTLSGVVELALRLGTLQPYRRVNLLRIQQELEQRHFSEATFHLLDLTAATNFISPDGELRNFSPDAQALLLLSLLGDESATKVMEERLTHFEKEREKSKKSQALESDPYLDSIEALRIQDLCCVHATRFMPQKNSDGEYQVPTSADARDWAVLRTTIHTSLNHKVQSHGAGDWGSTPIIIVCPMDRMIQANGNPTVLNTVDTYWSKNPGEELTFPNATLVEAREQQELILEDEKEKKVFFKNNNYTINDWHGLEALFLNNQDEGTKQDLYSIKYAFEQQLLDAIFAIDWRHYFNFLREEGNVGNEYNQVIEKLAPLLFGQDTRPSDPIVYDRLLGETANNQAGVYGCILDLLEKSDISSLLDPAYGTDVIRGIALDISKKVDGVLRSHLSDIATKKAIRSKGFRPQHGGMWSWNDSSEVTSQTRKLAQELGIETQAHNSTASAELEEHHLRSISRAMDEGKFHWEHYSFDITNIGGVWDHLPLHIDKPVLRTLMLSGFLFS
jgi:hypothetical protein